MPLEYLSNFWRSFEIPLINCKVELKLKWTEYCVLSVAGKENNINDDADANNIIFTIKDRKLYVPLVSLLAKIIKNYQNVLAKDLKYQFIGMNIKRKVIIKIQQMNFDISLNQILLESIDYSQFIKVRETRLKDLMLKNIIYQKT